MARGIISASRIQGKSLRAVREKCYFLGRVPPAGRDCRAGAEGFLAGAERDAEGLPDDDGRAAEGFLAAEDFPWPLAPAGGRAEDRWWTADDGR